MNDNIAFTPRIMQSTGRSEDVLQSELGGLGTIGAMLYIVVESNLAWRK